MADLKDLAKQYGLEDYKQLLGGYPNAIKFINALQSNIESHIPTTEDFQSPERMGEWSLAAALNQPAGLTFIGKNAKNWDTQAAKLAEEELNAGVDPAQVWKEHLIGRLPSGHLFSEISDKESKLPDWIEEKRINNEPIERIARMGTNLWHKDLYSNYPDLRSMQSTLIMDDRLPWEKPSTGNFKNNQITVEAGNLGDAKSTSLHELQHAIQHQENWPTGGNAKIFKSEYEYPVIRDANILDKMLNHYDILGAYDRFENRFGRKPEAGAEALLEAIGRGNITPEMIEKAKLAENPHDSYRRLAGEAQARATQDRLNMDMAQRRENYPLAGDKLSDIPLDQLIYRYGDDGPLLSADPLSKNKNYAEGGRVDKDSLPLNKPRRTPNHPTKSHIVKTMVDGKEKIIRFGEQGAETAGKPKAGESERMKQKRASFKARHAKNIAKGPSSAAYWADKVKWADGGSVEINGGISDYVMFGDEYPQIVNRAKSLADLLRSQNFGKNDSAILSTINHPITAARRGLNAFRNSVNTVAGLTEQYDNPNPLAGYTPEQQSEAALNLAGLMQTGAMPFAPSGAGTLGSIKAYHGTPHKFDRFDMSKIGTGEGAQAYGHGLYFAENPEVAEQYQKRLGSIPSVTDFLKSHGIDDKSLSTFIADDIVSKNGDWNKVASNLKSMADVYDDKDNLLLKKVAGLLEQKTPEISSGNIYETSIQWPDAARESADPLSEHHLLDWDKPFDQQSDYIKNLLSNYGGQRGHEIYKQIEQVAREKTPVMSKKAFDNREDALNYFTEAKQGYTGKDQFKPFVETDNGKFIVNYPEPSQFNQSGLGPVEDASNYLNSLGIPGIKYLDQGSRTGGGTSNYVMFGDEYPQIVNRASSLDELLNKYTKNALKSENYAQGGVVEYNPAEINKIIEKIHG